MDEHKNQETDGSTLLLHGDDSREVISFRKCIIKVAEGPDRSKKMDLGRKPIRIGKKEDNDFILTDNTVSRHHLQIEQKSDSFLLKDLDSTNGTTINGMRVKEAYLSPGDMIALGNTKIEFQAFDEKVQMEPSPRTSLGEMVGKSKKMRQIFGLCEKIAPTLATVIIEGETGTGKELVARAIHDYSLRKDKPFIVFDCSAVAPNLIESELFGHMKGSFTGAIKDRKGAFECANGGTIFLDEIGELALDLQPKLLRALEQREVRRVGSSEPIKVDVRLISATNRSLKDEVETKRFRQDLYYRLSVVKVNLPPLRERSEDIPLILEKFLAHGRYNRLPDGSLKVTRVEDDAIKNLQRYQWPGNVRELTNILERTISLVDGNSIDAQHLSNVFQEIEFNVEPTERMRIDTSLPFKEAKQKIVENFEKDYLVDLIKRNSFNVSRASREAQIDRKHLKNLLKKYDITAQDDGEDEEE
ncbi:MAG: sigma 54-interacting transcriptional regulator [Deltaproteobacteria bacterium]|nr:sigma 54-interacting transcriptional regulator [Deltaproteobacteria bacterium]